MKKRFTVLTVSMAAAVTLIPSAGGASADEGAVRIMCIGDSITDGYVSEYTGSYRKFIYHYLTEKGYDIDMVGAKDGGWLPEYKDEETGESFEFDNENTGYSGYAIKAYPGRNGILETLQQSGCLAETKPDIVTLQIGTNDVIDNHDIDGAGERLADLIGYILENIPDTSVLYVTTIPYLDPNREGVYDWFSNYRHSADWQTTYSDEEAEKAIADTVAKYNGIVEASVKDIQSQHSNVKFADVNSAITDVKTQLFDGVHPNNTGYRAMGTYWVGLLECEISKTPAETTAAPETTQAETTETEITTSAPEIADDIKVSDLVLFSSYLLGDTSKEYPDNRMKLCDINSDGKLDTFDLVLMRKKLTE